MKRSYLVSLLQVLFHLLLMSNNVLAQKTEENVFSKNVNPYSKSAIYEDEFDTSKFRLKIINSSFTEKGPGLSRVPSSLVAIKNKLESTPSRLCKVVKNNSGLEFKDSSAYVVSVLKKAGVIAADDKNFSYNNAHYLWEMFLTYRDFVDISQPIAREEKFSFDRLPDAMIVALEMGCNANGAVAIYCEGKFYTTKFVDIAALENRLNDSTDKSCKLGKGFRVLAEARRFL